MFMTLWQKMVLLGSIMCRFLQWQIRDLDQRLDSQKLKLKSKSSIKYSKLKVNNQKISIGSWKY